MMEKDAGWTYSRCCILPKKKPEGLASGLFVFKRQLYVPL